MAAYLPAEIAAGVTLELPVTLTAYPASDWTLTAFLRGPDAIDLVASADGDSHMLAADATTTAGWGPGRYWASLRVSDGSDVIEVEAAELRIVADLASASAGFDGRSHARRVLEAIEAVIEGRASIDQERYRINNRELQRTSIGDLLKLRDRYRDEVRREQAASRGSSLLGRRVLTRF